MDVKPLDFDGAFLVKPQTFPDDRGVFLEVFNQKRFTESIGHEMPLGQVNCSVSRKGVVRGVHAQGTPPGQAKYFTCVSGAIISFVVDLRVGSPHFGESITVPLDEDGKEALHVAEGLGHAFAPLTDEATVMFLCSTVWDPAAQIVVTPFCPDLALPWPDSDEHIVSAKDGSAPTLAEAEEQGLLPSYGACRKWYHLLRNQPSDTFGETNLRTGAHDQR